MGKPASASKNSPLLDYLDGLMEELHKNVPKALRDFDENAIHDARVATRRLKAAMDLLKPLLRDDHRQAFEKVLKKLRKRLGPLRDLDVMIESLGKLKTNAAAAWLRDELVRRRDAERQKARKKTAPADVLAKLGAWWPPRQEIAEAGDAAIESLLSQSLHLQFDAFAEQVAAGDSPWQAGQIEAQSSQQRRDPHQLRIAGKLLRYTLEVAKAQGHKLPATVLKGFKKMQTALGTWHDNIVLVECILQTSLDCQLSYHELQRQAQLLKLAQLFLARSVRELAKFSGLWRQHGQEVAATIREKFPLGHPVTAPQTGPGPIDSGDKSTPAAPPPDVASTA